MTSLAWMTDIHLNFLDSEELFAFVERTGQRQVDGFLIGGDIGEADDICHYLTLMAGHWQRPIYFVLGNHDYYRSSIDRVRDSIELLSRQSDHLFWLPDRGPIELEEKIWLAGHGGWGDGGYGDFLSSEVRLNDYILITDFHNSFRDELFEKLQGLGRQSAENLGNQLSCIAESGGKKIYILTHVPPFAEACWHEGKAEVNDWTPHFSCRATGEVLAEFADSHSQIEISVLCGHTHGEGEVKMAKNLTVFTGGAEYYKPEIQKIIEIDS